MPAPLVANLVCGSPWRNHDFDFARLRLGQAIYDLDGIRVDCYQDYEDSGGIANGDLLVSYTSQVPVTDKASTNLRRWLEKGGRWFALHASNRWPATCPCRASSARASSRTPRYRHVPACR